MTDNAVEGVKKSFNDRLDQYGDIIQIGLVLGVIIIGGRHLTSNGRKNRNFDESYIPALTSGQQPIVINNYYKEREDRYERYKREDRARRSVQSRYSTQQENQKYQNRR